MIRAVHAQGVVAPHLLLSFRPMNDAAAPVAIGPRSGALIAWLDPILAARGTTLDPAQAAALDRLQALASELEAFRAARRSTLKKIFAPPDVPRGVYLWGGVGRGKSFLMDAFFATVAIRRKTRVHFHAFMRDVHEELARAEARSRSARDRRGAHRAQMAAHLLRRVPRRRHRRRDDPRPPAVGALRARRRVRDDDELRARRAVAERPAARAVPADDRAPRRSGSTSSRSTPGSTTGCGRWSRSRPITRPSMPAAEAALAAAFESMRAGPDDDPKLVDRGPDARRAAAGGQRRLVRLRHAVRRPPVAARLPRARPPLLGALPLRASRG